jgi:hypothetical protein
MLKKNAQKYNKILNAKCTLLGFDLFPLSSILENRKQDVSENGTVPILR